MALKVGELFATLRLDDTDFATKLQTAGARFEKTGASLKNIGKSMTMGLTLPMAAAAGGAIKLAADMQQTKIAFTSMLGSGERAAGFINELKEFAAKTPFELPGLVNASRQLLAFGFDAEKIVPMMTSIGDAVAALGGGEFEINRVTRALGQMQAKGKVSAEEMMQLAELGIPVWELLAKKIGTDIPTAMKKASSGAIDAATGINAILTGMTEKFGGMMAEQSKTFLGRLSTLKDNATQALMAVGEALLPLAEKLMAFAEPAVVWLKKVGESFAALPGPIQGVVIGLTGLTAMAGPMLYLVGSLAGAALQIGNLVAQMPKLNALLSVAAGPAGWIMLAVGALAAMGYFISQASNQLEHLNQTMDSHIDKLQKMTTAQRENLFQTLKIREQEQGETARVAQEKADASSKNLRLKQLALTVMGGPIGAATAAKMEADNAYLKAKAKEAEDEYQYTRSRLNELRSLRSGGLTTAPSSTGATSMPLSGGAGAVALPATGQTQSTLQQMLDVQRQQLELSRRQAGGQVTT